MAAENWHYQRTHIKAKKQFYGKKRTPSSLVWRTLIKISLGDGFLIHVCHLLDIVHTTSNDVSATDDIQRRLKVIACRSSAAWLNPEVKHHKCAFHVGVEVCSDVIDLWWSDAELRRQLDPVRLDCLCDVCQTQLCLRNVFLCDTTSAQLIFIARVFLS